MSATCCRPATARALTAIAALALVAGVGTPLEAPGTAGNTALVTAAPTNLLSPAQADFTTASTAGWTVAGGIDARVASPTDATPGSLGVLATGTSGVSVWSAGVSGAGCSGSLVPAIPGTVYAATASTEASLQGASVETVLVFCDGPRLGTVVWGPATAAGPAGWTGAAAAVAVAPAGTTGVVMGLVVASTSTDELLYVDRAQLTAQDPTSAVVDGPLTTVGNRIVQADGQPVVLRGVDLFGLEDSGSSPAASQASIADIRSWGATMVRVSLGEQLWLPNSCAYDPTYAATVQQVVKWITQDGMVALLDLHFSNPADLYPSPAAASQAAAAGRCAAAGQAPMADSGSVAFWQQVASTFASNPLVAFDLYNEPYDVTQPVWLGGGSAPDPNPGGPPTYPVVGMQQLYDTVRSTGAANLVVVSGENWANTVPTSLVQGRNIVYSVHAYTCPDAPPPATTCASDPTSPAGILGPWASLSAYLPVMVGEFGWPATDQSTYMANVIAEASRYGWSWDAFAWDGTPGSAWSLLQRSGTSSGPGGPFEPSPSGMPVLCAMAYQGAVTAPSPCATLDGT